MIGLVLVTHGRLAEELRSAMEHVVGVQRNVATVCIGPDDDIEGRRAEIHRCIDTVDTGDGVVLLTDMFGGTPSNLAISQMDREGVEVIAGVNLPMLVKLAKVRSNQRLADAVDCAQTAGRKYIAAASHVLPHQGTNVPRPAPACNPESAGALCNVIGSNGAGNGANDCDAGGAASGGPGTNGVAPSGGLANGGLANGASNGTAANERPFASAAPAMMVPALRAIGPAALGQGSGGRRPG